MITTKARLDNLDTVDGRHSDNFDTVCFDMLLEHPENFFFWFIFLPFRFTTAVSIVFKAKTDYVFRKLRKQRQFSSKESIIYTKRLLRLSVNAFSNTVWQIQFTSRLSPCFLLFFRQISKKHLNERQILAIQYISRGAYPSFANFCNRGEDYGWWEGGFSYQISLQDFEQCENHFPMCKKPKAP